MIFKKFPERKTLEQKNVQCVCDWCSLLIAIYLAIFTAEKRKVWLFTEYSKTVSREGEGRGKLNKDCVSVLSAELQLQPRSDALEASSALINNQIGGQTLQLTTTSIYLSSIAGRTTSALGLTVNLWYTREGALIPRLRIRRSCTHCALEIAQKCCQSPAVSPPAPPRLMSVRVYNWSS